MGPYSTKNYTGGYKDGAHFADATIYYPDSADAKPPFGLVAVVPGFVGPQSNIQSWGPLLASHGIVTITIGSNSPTDQPPERELALMDALDSLALENTRMASPLLGKLDTSRRAVMGHSMGGGGSLLAARDHPTLSAAIGLNPYEQGDLFSSLTVPTLLFTATGDPVAVPAQHAYAFYAQIPSSTKKMLWSLRGGDHSTAMNPTGANNQVGAYALSWLKVFLEGDTRYLAIVKSTPAGTARFEDTL